MPEKVTGVAVGIASRQTLTSETTQRNLKKVARDWLSPSADTAIELETVFALLQEL